MKIDFAQKMLGPKGDDLGFALGAVAVKALNAPSERTLTFSEAVKRGELAILVGDDGEHEITPEDAALIRQALPVVWAPIIVARAAKMLE